MPDVPNVWIRSRLEHRMVLLLPEPCKAHVLLSLPIPLAGTLLTFLASAI